MQMLELGHEEKRPRSTGIDILLSEPQSIEILRGEEMELRDPQFVKCTS